MKVGLFIGSLKPTDGGGFTFVAEFLKELDRSARELNHDFIVFYDSADDVARIAANLTRVSLQAEKGGVLCRKERFFGRLPGVCGRTWDRVWKVSPRLSWDARVYRKHGIEFVVRLVPWNAMTMDLPFGAIVWDLQHRNNPWFPEVCQMGEWEGRERNFSTLCRRASLIITGTQRGMDEIDKYYQVPRERITVIPFPTPTFALDCQSVSADRSVLRKFNLPQDYIFYPAQFWPHKDHVTVLEACRLVRDKMKWDLGVAFVGSAKGNQVHVKRYADRLGLQSSTRFLNYVGQDDLVQLYKQAFCMTFATLCGPDNLPPLEAFALQCPVLATAVPGAEEQLGDAARLFPPTDETALAANLIELKNTPELRMRLIEAGLRRAGRHTWTEYVRRFATALDSFGKIRRAWGT